MSRVAGSRMKGKAGSAQIETGGVYSYSFVWGSPDSFNTVTVYGGNVSSANGPIAVFTGSILSGGTEGDNSKTKLFTITSDSDAIDGLVISPTGVAFEIAVAAVPEPETYAMMLAGLGAVGFVAVVARTLPMCDFCQDMFDSRQVQAHSNSGFLHNFYCPKGLMRGLFRDLRHGLETTTPRLSGDETTTELHDQLTPPIHPLTEK